MSGYTDYMRTLRMSLAHAEINTARLLETVIDAAPGFELVEIEGDAAFVSRDVGDLDDAALVALTFQTALAMHRAFHQERRYVVANLCPCNGCNEADQLRLFHLRGMWVRFRWSARRGRDAVRRSHEPGDERKQRDHSSTGEAEAARSQFLPTSPERHWSSVAKQPPNRVDRVAAVEVFLLRQPGLQL